MAVGLFVDEGQTRSYDYIICDATPGFNTVRPLGHISPSQGNILLQHKMGGGAQPVWQ